MPETPEPETPKFEQFKSAIARIYSSNGLVVGAGFWVSADCLLTCAHVITSALGLPQDTSHKPETLITLDFPLGATKESFQATVILWRPVQPGVAGEDIAVLKVRAPLPPGIQPVPLAADSGHWGSPIRMFGFPKDRDEGIWVTSTLREKTGAGLVQMDAIAAEGGRAVEKGFSGAPIWDETLQAVVGMAIAAEKRRDAVTAAYMTPLTTLAKYALDPLARQRLAALLEPHAAQLMPAAQAAHCRLRPPGWPRPIPASLAGILEDLADMPDRDGHVPLCLFVAVLIFNNSVPQLAASLRAWLEAKGLSIPGLLDYYSQLNDTTPDATNQTIHPYLLVQVRPSLSEKPNEYFVDGCLRQESEEGVPYGTIQPLALPGEIEGQAVKDATEATFSLQQIPGVVAGFLDQVGNAGIALADLTVEFFVPLALLNQAIEGWPAEDSFGVDGVLCQECQQLHLRSSERFAKNYRPKGLWQKKWQHVQTVKQAPARDLFLPRNPQEAKNLSRELKRPEAVAFKSCQGNLSTEKGGPLALILGTGTPIALWLRQTLACAHEVDALLDCCLDTVSAQVAEKRREAYDNDDATHLGSHLALIWENPHRVPPRIDYA